MASVTPTSSSSAGTGIPEAHLALLQDNVDDSLMADFATAALFTENVRLAVDYESSDPDDEPTFSQYGLLGGDVTAGNLDRLASGDLDPRVFYNTAAPSSTFICGSQGSGKSHTLSVLLENSLAKSVANVLPRPLTGLLFHRDSFVSETAGAPCEAAYLSSNPDISVRVLCAPSNIMNIRRIYSSLPNVSVEELRINQSDLNTSRMLGLMAVHTGKDGGMPLYLYVLNRILRDLRIEQQRSGLAFNYGKFKATIGAEAMLDSQLLPLQQRLETLESFMVQDQAPQYKLGMKNQQPQKQSPKAKKSSMDRQDIAKGNIWFPKSGQLTIVDLSCPCITAEIACSLFGICLSLFLEQSSDVGRIVALDEAHKFMNDSSECASLTDGLLHTIRMQRHLAARVIISTQEPTISTKLLDLCTMTIVHRFTSPDWLLALKKHLAGASKHTKADTDDFSEATSSSDAGVRPLVLKGDDYMSALFSQIVSLRTGEALVFAPSAVIDVDYNPCDDEKVDDAVADGSSQEVLEPAVDSGAKLYAESDIVSSPKSSVGDDACSTADDAYDSDESEYFPSPKKLGDGVLKLRIRMRVTADGGRSVMAH
uniref:Zona occludens toxin N-terminal domain-containing protein n=1 Tax=Bionectria ochroleuca TaxID=29856 RepID=A0A8H7N6L8_BIOOC